MTWALDWISYPRAIFMLLLGAVSTVTLSILVVLAAGLTKSRRLVDFIIVRLWSVPLVLASGVRVEVRGAELVRNSPKGFLILFNHSSLFDILVLFGYFPRSFRYGAKVELFKIPFFGKAMEVVGILPIDRGNRNKVMKIYNQAISRIDNGECFALAPEGTRQDSTELGRFKRGPFEFAINAQVNIVPVILAGAYDVLPKTTLRVNWGRFRRKVILQILPPVPASEHGLENVEALQEQVRAQMAPVLTRLNAEINS